MSRPASPGTFVILLFIIVFLFIFIQVQAISIVFSKLGLSPNGAALLLFGSLFGSLVNLPLFQIQANAPADARPAWPFQNIWRREQPPFSGHTVIAINGGGGLIPVGFSIYLVYIHSLPLTQILGAIAIIATISFLVSRPVPGLGIGMPVFIAPLAAALTALLINTELAAPLAYIGGTLGVLTGADLFRLRDIRNMGIPVASIGGAGTFDGIFITGIIAVLLT